MLLHPYFLNELAQQRQADFLAEAAHEAVVAEILRAQTASSNKPAQRQKGLIRRLTWSTRQPSLAIRTDMPA